MSVNSGLWSADLDSTEFFFLSKASQIFKSDHLAESGGVVPGVHGEELGWVVGEAEHVDTVPANSHDLVQAHPYGIQENKFRGFSYS